METTGPAWLGLEALWSVNNRHAYAIATLSAFFLLVP